MNWPAYDGTPDLYDQEEEQSFEVWVVSGQGEDVLWSHRATLHRRTRRQAVEDAGVDPKRAIALTRQESDRLRLVVR